MSSCRPSAPGADALRGVHRPDSSTRRSRSRRDRPAVRAPEGARPARRARQRIRTRRTSAALSQPDFVEEGDQTAPKSFRIWNVRRRVDRGRRRQRHLRPRLGGHQDVETDGRRTPPRRRFVVWRAWCTSSAHPGRSTSLSARRAERGVRFLPATCCAELQQRSYRPVREESFPAMLELMTIVRGPRRRRREADAIFDAARLAAAMERSSHPKASCNAPGTTCLGDHLRAADRRDRSGHPVRDLVCTPPRTSPASRWRRRCVRARRWCTAERLLMTCAPARRRSAVSRPT